MNISPFAPDLDKIDNRTVMSVKTFILRASRENVGWPGYPCTIWIDGKSYLVRGGIWQISGDNVWVGEFNPGGAPSFAPIVLKAIALYFNLMGDPEIVTAIEDFLVRVMTNTVRTYSTPMIHTTVGGRAVEAMAYNLALPDQPIASRIDLQWVLPNGEQIDIDQPGWIVMEGSDSGSNT